MKICVSSTGASIESAVDARFGRCAFFIIVDADTMQFESFGNDASGAAGGAGVQSGKFVADKGAKAILSGNFGPKAFDTLMAAGLEIVTVEPGITVMEAVTNYKAGMYKPIAGPTSKQHSGMRG